MAFEKVVQICFNYRDGRPFSVGALSTFEHKGATGKVCDDKGYLSTGFCKNFGDCKNTHPWDESKWGKPEEAVAKINLRAQKCGNLTLECTISKTFKVPESYF